MQLRWVYEVLHWPGLDVSCTAVQPSDPLILLCLWWQNSQQGAGLSRLPLHLCSRGGYQTLAVKGGQRCSAFLRVLSLWVYAKGLCCFDSVLQPHKHQDSSMQSKDETLHPAANPCGHTAVWPATSLNIPGFFKFSFCPHSSSPVPWREALGASEAENALGIFQPAAHTKRYTFSSEPKPYSWGAAVREGRRILLFVFPCKCLVIIASR